jgi:nucleoside-diphosphate-sugar epimerase
MYNILVVGAGYLGSAIAREFKNKKQRVYAVTRSAEKAAALEKEEILPVVADLTQPESLEKIPAAHFVILCAAPDTGDEAHYRKIYEEGVRNFLESRAKLPRPYLIVGISSTSVWKDRAGEWVDEALAADADTEKGKILRASEKLILESGYPAVIFRLSGIYGPGRNRLESFKRGRWPSPEETEGYMNMIHVEDAAQALPLIFKKAKEGEVYIGTDDEPVLRSEFCRWLSEKTGKKTAAQFDSRRVGGKRLKNDRLKEMGIQLTYPTFREGYEGFLRGQS